MIESMYNILKSILFMTQKHSTTQKQTKTILPQISRNTGCFAGDLRIEAGKLTIS